MIIFLPQTQATPTAEMVLARVKNFSRQAKTLSVDIKLTSNGAPEPGTARIVFSRPNHMLFTVKWKDIDYSSTTTPAGGWNAEYEQHLYEDTVNKSVQAVFSDI